MSDKPRSPFARCYSVPGGFSITVDREQAIMDNIETIRNMTMPKTTEKPRENPPPNWEEEIEKLKADFDRKLFKLKRKVWKIERDVMGLKA